MMRFAAFVAIVCLFVPACGARKEGGSNKTPVAAAQDAGAASVPSLGGNPLAMFSLLADRLDEPGPYDELKEVKPTTGDAQFAVLELSGSIAELRSFSLWQGMSGIELRTIRNKLATLDVEKNVAGVILRMEDVAMSMAAAEELRAAMKALEKPLLCHAETLSMMTYYLASSCDQLALAPNGMLSISGVAAVPMHIKGLLDRFGVRADFVHVGSFKGAAEPLTRPAPSPEMKKTLDDILAEQYKSMVAAIAERPGLDEAKAVQAIDQALYTPETAREAGLIDEIAVFEQFRESQRKEAGWKKHSFSPSADKQGLAEVMTFLGTKPLERPSKPHVALVYAVGNVIDGNGEGMIGARGEIASRTLVPALRAIGKDDRIKAVVLRVDSPGGSAIASEAIWAELEGLAKKKPVVVSMAGVAASGGYYISAGAKKIFANPNTLTGSIGVVGGKLTFGRTLANYGVSTHPQGRGKHAQLWSGVSAWTPEERKAVLSTMEDVYRTFKSRVAAGRNMPVEKVEEVAQGRVWTGRAAVERGLVDELGGLDAAIAEARKLGEVAPEVELEVYPPEPTLRDFIATLGNVRSPMGIFSEAQSALAAVDPIMATRAGKLLQAVWQLRETRIMAVTFLPSAL